MSKFDDAIEMLDNYRMNAARIALDARLALEFMHIVRYSREKAVKDLLLERIKDHVGNLPWGADPDLAVNFDDLEEELAAAIKSSTGRKMKWHPRWFE